MGDNLNVRSSLNEYRSSIKKYLWSESDSLQKVINFETHTPRQKEEILDLLDKLENIDWKKWLPFFSIEKKWITFDNIQHILSDITSLFEWWIDGNDQLRIKISNMIAGATEKERNLEKILFVWSPMDNHWLEYRMTSELWDKINKQNNIDIWNENGNGWYYEKIHDFDGHEFAYVYVTEHKTIQTPNAVVVVIAANRRPRYIMMDKSHSLSQNEKDSLRKMSDQEVKERYYVTSYD